MNRINNKNKAMNNKINVSAFARMIQVLREKGIDNVDFQARLNVRSQHWTNWKNSGLPSSRHFAVADALGINIDWLVSGKGEKYKLKGSYDGERRKGVPMIQWSQVQEFVAGEEVKPTKYMPECPNAHGSRTFALQVANDSMTASGAKSYPLGAVVYVDPDLEASSGNRVIVGSSGGDCRLREYVKDGNIIYLKPLNPQYPIQELADNLIIYGVVIGTFLPE